MTSTNFVSKHSTLLIGLIIVLVTFLPGAAFSDSTIDRTELSTKIWVQGGFFTPARETMRSIYGNALNCAGGVERRICSRFSLGAYGGYLEQNKGTIQLKYRNIYVVPTVTFLLHESKRLGLYSQLGVGLNFREVFSLKWFYEQRDFGLSGNLALGFDYLLAGPLVLGARTTFDYIFDADPTLGDFGNTGGWNFQLTGGLMF